MKSFKVINKGDCSDGIWGEDDCRSVIITMPESEGYTDDDILRKIKWNRSKVEIIDITPKEIK